MLNGQSSIKLRGPVVRLVGIVAFILAVNALLPLAAHAKDEGVTQQRVYKINLVIQDSVQLEIANASGGEFSNLGTHELTVFDEEIGYLQKEGLQFEILYEGIRATRYEAHDSLRIPDASIVDPIRSERSLEARLRVPEVKPKGEPVDALALGAMGIENRSGSTTTDQPLSDGSIAYSPITISGAPAGAKVDHVEYSWNIDHDRVSDLRGWFGTDHWSNLIEDGYYSFYRPSATGDDWWDGYSETYADSDTYTSSNLRNQSVNDEWLLAVEDFWTNYGGRIDSWSITVFYKVKDDTKMSCSNPSTVKWGKPVTLKARLTDTDILWPDPIPYVQVRFVYNGRTYTDNTDSDGWAQVTVPAHTTVGSKDFCAYFDGNSDWNSSYCCGSVNTSKRNTNLYGEEADPNPINEGSSTTFKVKLRDSDNSNSGISGRSVCWQKFNGIYWSDVSGSCRTTNGSGWAYWDYTPTLVPEEPGDSVDVEVLSSETLPDGSGVEFQVKETLNKAQATCPEVHTQTYRAVFNGDSKYNSSTSGNVPLQIRVRCCSKVAAENVPGKWGKPVTLRARLTDCDILWPDPIPYVQVRFVYNGQTYTDNTDADGWAEVTVTAHSTVSSLQYCAYFDGNDAYKPSSDCANVNTQKHDTYLTTPTATPNPVNEGSSVTFCVYLKDSDMGSSGIGNRSVCWQKHDLLLFWFDLEGSCRTTDASGKACWTYSPTLAPEDPGDSLDVEVLSSRRLEDNQVVEFEVRETLTKSQGTCPEIHTQKYRAKFAGDSKYNSSHSPEIELDVSVRCCSDIEVADSEGEWGKEVTLRARLTDCDWLGKDPLPGRILHFDVAGEGAGSDATDSDGWAEFTYEAPPPPKDYVVTVSFEGDNSYKPIEKQGTLQVLKQGSQLVDATADPNPVGESVGTDLTVYLKDKIGSGSALSGKTVYWRKKDILGFWHTIDGSSSSTDANGKATYFYVPADHKVSGEPIETELQESKVLRDSSGIEYRIVERRLSSSGALLDNTVTLQARFDGDSHYGGCESSNVSLSVDTDLYSFWGQLLYQTSPGGCVSGVTCKLTSSLGVEYLGTTDDNGEVLIEDLPRDRYFLEFVSNAAFNPDDWEWYGNPPTGATTINYDVTLVPWRIECKANPSIRVVTSPSSYEPGQPFDVVFELENDGEAVNKAPVYASISLLTDVTGSATGSGMSISEHQIGDPITHAPSINFPCGNEFSAANLLFDGHRVGIASHATNSVTVTVVPDVGMVDNIVILYRAAIGDRVFPEMSDCEQLDQQGWCARRVVVSKDDGDPALTWAHYHLGSDEYLVKLRAQAQQDLSYLLFNPLKYSRDNTVVRCVSISEGQSSSVELSRKQGMLAKTQSIFKFAKEIDVSGNDVRDVLWDIDLQLHQRDPLLTSGPYTVYAPIEPYGWWKEAFLFGFMQLGGLDDQWHRADVYGDLILDAVLQPDLAESPQDNLEAQQELFAILDQIGTGSEFASLIVDIKNYHTFTQLDPQQVKDFFTWMRGHGATTKVAKFGEYLGKVSVVLDALGYAVEVGNDATFYLLQHTLMTAHAENRLDAIEYAVSLMDDPDPALISGVEKARERFEEMNVEWYGSLEAVFDAATQGSQLVDLAFLTAEVGLLIAGSPYAAVLGPYALSWKIYSGLRDKMRTAKLATLAATLQRELTEDAILDVLNSAHSGNHVYEPYASHSLDLLNMSHYLSYYYYDRWLSIVSDEFATIFGHAKDFFLPGTPWEDRIADLENLRGTALEYVSVSSPPAYLTRHESGLDVDATDNEYSYLMSLLSECNPTPVLNAAFMVSQTEGRVPFSITLTDNSENAQSWEWHVGDQTLIGEGPHTVDVSEVGSLPISLTVSDGDQSDVSEVVTVSCLPPLPEAAFVASGSTDGIAPFQVCFSNQSTGYGDMTYLWSFGDGSTSAEEDACHTFNLPGVYTVTLQVSAEGGSDEKTVPGMVSVAGSVGTILVDINIPDGAFIVEGNGVQRSGGGQGSHAIDNLPLGTYAVTFLDVTGFGTPASQLVELTSSTPQNVTGSYSADATPPEAVELFAGSWTPDGLHLTWPAPSDNMGDGRVHVYDLRYSIYRITDDNWDGPDVHEVDGEPTPGMPGTEESYVFDYPLLAGDYYFRLRSADISQNWSLLSNELIVTGTEIEDSDLLPDDFLLCQNYPNPFNPTTTIQFELPTRSKVKLSVYNVLGRHVLDLVDEQLAAGHHSATWDARNSDGVSVAAGVYLYRLETETYLQTRKMVLLK